jgi:hypothetical protein
VRAAEDNLVRLRPEFRPAVGTAPRMVQVWKLRQTTSTVHHRCLPRLAAERKPAIPAAMTYGTFRPCGGERRNSGPLNENGPPCGTHIIWGILSDGSGVRQGMAGHLARVGTSARAALPARRRGNRTVGGNNGPRWTAAECRQVVGGGRARNSDGTARGMGGLLSPGHPRPRDSLGE